MGTYATYRQQCLARGSSTYSIPLRALDSFLSRFRSPRWICIRSVCVGRRKCAAIWQQMLAVSSGKLYSFAFVCHQRKRYFFSFSGDVRRQLSTSIIFNIPILHSRFSILFSAFLSLSICIHDFVSTELKFRSTLGIVVVVDGPATRVPPSQTRHNIKLTARNERRIGNGNEWFAFNWLKKRLETLEIRMANVNVRSNTVDHFPSKPSQSPDDRD